MQRAVVSSQRSVLPLCGRALCYARGGRTIIDDVDITIRSSDGTIALVGPNGAGKSVLIRLVAGLLQPDSGTVKWADRVPDERLAPRIGFVFQRPVLLRRSARANIEFALAASGIAKDDRRERASAALAMAGLAHIGETDADVLSGGEQQRLALARALACNPEVFVLDEPTANLDPASTAAIEKMLQSIRSAGTPIVLITHDLGQARRLSDQVVFLHHGRIRERTPSTQYFALPQSPEAQQFMRGEIVL
jgi:tungstate transport system ATP-binding protein